jgi:nucleoside-diphosphate-sugar epimerase
MQVVVTGAAGLIGGEVVRRLAEAGHAVTALVHRTHLIIANDGRVVASRPWDGPPAPGTVATLAADVRAAGVGLAVDPRPDLIVPAAAITAFDAPSATYQAVNIDGTANVIALAERRGTPLLQVSTAYVCGTRDGPIGETERGSAFTNGYEASKAAAEALVEAAAARGLPTVIARPSIVVGDSRDGTLREFANIYTVFRLIAEGRLRTLPGRADATLDLVPIDHVARGIVALVQGFEAARERSVHLVAATATPLAALGAAIASVPGLGRPTFVPPATFDAAALPPAERRWHLAAAALYTGYLQRAPRFDTANSHLLVPRCPPTDAAWLRRLIAACVARGFVTARRDNACPTPAALCSAPTGRRP